MSHSYKRWYDHDPVLLEVINLLQNYQAELKAQAEIFLAEVEKKVSKEAIDKIYNLVDKHKGNNKINNMPFFCPFDCHQSKY